MPKKARPRKTKDNPTPVSNYQHPEAKALLRPDVGVQPQFKKKKPPATYRYDSSLAPELNWDGQNPGREMGEWLLACIEEALQLEPPHKFPTPKEFRDGRGNVIRVAGLTDAVEQLKRLAQPFLNWSGKAERLSFDVPTLPLFVHERLSTRAIIETLKGHKRDKQMDIFDLFADPRHSITDQVLRAYEHLNGWTNRMILGDSLMAMNSLLHYEGLGGQVQMIYIDPPYGVKFGSNFQPFVRKRDVKHNDDEDMTREPEMVKAYRDTWELGLHSYLTYMRDRLLLARDLLHPSGSVFVQISDENVHHVREVMDEVFGEENAVAVVPFVTTTGRGAALIDKVTDYLIWYAKERPRAKFNNLFESLQKEQLDKYWSWLELDDGTVVRLSQEQLTGDAPIPNGRRFLLRDLTSQGASEGGQFEYEFEGQKFTPTANRHWSTTQEGMDRLAGANRFVRFGPQLRGKRYVDDFPVSPINNLWTDTQTGSFIGEKIYVVQTNTKVVQRCMLMTTDPGDLVLDPTCVRKGTRVLTPLNPPANGGKINSSFSAIGRKNSLPGCGESQGGASPSANEGIAPHNPPVNEGKSISPSPCAGRVGVGSIPIENLHPGDFVYSHDGQPHRVTRLIKKKYSGKMIGLRHEGSDKTLWLTEDHLVLANRRVQALSEHGGWSGVPAPHFDRAKKLRTEMSPPERLLWSRLRSEQLGVKFRRQHPVGPYIVDFYTRDAGLVIEVDGSQHYEANAIEYDGQRDAYLQSIGLRVLRFNASQVSRNLSEVVGSIFEAARENVLSDNPSKQWRYAGNLAVGDTVFMGADGQPCKIVELREEESVEEVFDIEVEEVHSFLTEVCAVHNCGSGTTAYVCEQWGRRWITMDVSRVPLALARQRLLTATFPYYELKDESRGPVSGFEYKRKQNSKGEEVGGIVPHVTLKSIANNEPPQEEVLVDRPEVKSGITRVTGPFTFEATIPTPVDWEGDGEEDSGVEAEPIANYIERMLEILRRSPVLHLAGGKTVTLKSIRTPSKTLSLHAEAESAAPDLGDLADEASKQKGLDLKKRPPVAIVFGPENGAVSEKLVYEAAREARAKSYDHLYVIGFNIQATARELVENCDSVVGIPAAYVQATPDILMGDLLKTMRSSQIFSVCGLPEVKIATQKDGTYKVHLLGVDVFDPIEMKSSHQKGEDAPAWFLDTDYNGLCFHVSQAFFPRTSAWDSLKKALRATHEESVWDHLAGAVSAPFEAGEFGQIAVKVIDDRGNELMVVKKLEEAL